MFSDRTKLTVTKLIGLALLGAIAFPLLSSTQIIAQTPSSVDVESGKNIPMDFRPEELRPMRAECIKQILRQNSQDLACQSRPLTTNNTNNRPLLVCRILVLKDAFGWKCPQTQRGNRHGR